jgi:hypothetical protein
MNDVIRRWQRAAERADEERVRVLAINDELRATSTSHPFSSYLLHITPGGWACECRANAEFGMPCKHLSALADLLNLDVLSDVRLNWDELSRDPGLQPAA